MNFYFGILTKGMYASSIKYW